MRVLIGFKRFSAVGQSVVVALHMQGPHLGVMRRPVRAGQHGVQPGGLPMALSERTAEPSTHLQHGQHAVEVIHGTSPPRLSAAGVAVPLGAPARARADKSLSASALECDTCMQKEPSGPRQPCVLAAGCLMAQLILTPTLRCRVLTSTSGGRPCPAASRTWRRCQSRSATGGRPPRH